MQYLKTGRLRLHMLLLVLFGIGQRVGAQQNPMDQKVSIVFEGVSAVQALKQLGAKTGYFFNYANSDLDANRSISRIYQGERLESIIKDIWGNPNVQIRVSGRTVDIQSSRSNSSKQKGTIMGKVTDNFNAPVPFASVILKNTPFGASSDENGNFSFTAPSGTYTIATKVIGYQETEKSITISPNKTVITSLIITEQSEQLNEVVVTGKTESAKIAQQPIPVTSIDVNPLKAEATNTIGVLTRASGVRVRQSGGLGSRAQIQLNGLTGNSVRQYYDGIPLELLSGGIRLNNIPVNAIDRIDIFKGIMPIDIGTDALAGGINVVPKRFYNSYLEASYELGSFNTHIVSFNAAKVLKEHFFVALNGFFNYSDNNYSMRNIPVASFETFTNAQGNEQQRIVESIETVERFHDQHRSSFAEVQVGIRDLKWADEAILSTGFTQRFDEFQHGVRVEPRPAGEVTLENRAFFQNLKFEKEIKTDLLLKYFGNYTIVREEARDSTQNLYNWFGAIETAQTLANGAEILAEPSLRDGRTFVTAHRLSVEYTFLSDYKLNLSNFLPIGV